jgi:small subunit ribosomal protein S3
MPDGNSFADLLLEDVAIRKFIANYLQDKKARQPQRPAIADIRIERTRERVTVIVTSSRVGAIIGKKGEKIDKLTKALEKLTRRHIEV